ncbi:hypothetical protein HDU96_006286 [Phlyctochytrium bullatum]|nr:hypothetical protein HDU96_006286 [Phlyctochytrium bullatum]
MVILDRLLARLKANGLGINLATADIVIMYDSDWNPQVDLQAEDRAHRIGQTKQVIVFRFITENAIEEKVIDRATQKLRLDQLVIQQGRASGSTKASAANSKEELLSMIQHGAETIFQSNDSTISADDIEEVLRRGEEKTMELDKKYNSMGLDDVKNFMSDGSVYQWEGADFRSQRKEGKEFRWIQPAKREKRVGSYAVDDYFREALRVGHKASGPKVPKIPKSVIVLNEFQFFPPELSDLLEKELNAQKKAQGVKVQKRAPQAPDEDDEFLERERLEEQAKIDNGKTNLTSTVFRKFNHFNIPAEQWTDADQAEKEALLQQLRSHVDQARDNIVEIAKEIEGKTQDEVRRYSEVFWKRYKEIPDWEKHIGNIEKGERLLQKQFEIQEALSRKISSSRLPLQQLRFNYGQSRGKNFTEEEDRFMEIQKRCSTLIGLIQKEEAEEREREERKRKAMVLSQKSEKANKKKRKTF